MAALIDKMLDAMEQTEAEFIPTVRDSLIAAMDVYVVQVRTQGVFLPLPTSAKQTLIANFVDLWGYGADRAISTMRGEFKDAFPDLESKDKTTLLLQRITSDYIERYGANSAAGIISTTEKQMADLIKGGLTRGQAAAEVYRQVSDKILDIADSRAEVITRTESHAINQFASQLMAQRSAVALKKKWNSNKDDRTRRFGLFGRQDAFNHLIMDGQEVSLEQAFSVPRRTGGVERLIFPGDPNGSAGNVINCRCIQTYERLD